MAKADFCFTYYDGDAARDMAHMNRLERGAYTDIIISQRKFGHLSLDQIKKILGKDFTDCWGAIELVLNKKDGKYFIEWLQNSEIKAKKHSFHQSENGKKGGRPKAVPNPNESKTKPLGDGDGNEDVLGDKAKNEFDFSKPDIQGDELIFPIDTPAFRAIWANWKKYRWSEHEQRYGMMGEQADLKRLEKMDFKQMEQTILSAIANKWKNLYPEKNGFSKNTAGKTGGVKADQSRATSDYLTEYYRNKAEQK